MTMFTGADKDKQRLALDLMGRRRMTSGLPALVKATGDADLKLRTDAIKMIGELGGPDQLPTMFNLLKNASQSQELAAIEQATTAICLKATDSKAEADKVIGQLDKVQPSQKAALVRVLGAVGGTNGLQAIITCARSDNADVRSAATRALATWKTVDAAPSLLTMIKQTTDSAEKTLFLRGYLNLAARNDLPVEDRIAMCRQAASQIVRDEEKRLLLGTLGGIQSPEAVELIVPYVDDAGSRQEAVLAAVTVSERLLRGRGPAPFAAKLIPLLEKVAQAASGDLTKRANAVLERAKEKANGQ
jgi:HEAT repeat protein